MPKYQYRAVDEKGHDASGTMEQDSAVRVTAILQEQGLQVTSVEPVERGAELPRMQTRLSWGDIDQLNHHLLAITRSGLPLAPSLKALATEVRGAYFKGVLDSLRQSLEAGHTLEEALNAQPRQFPEVYRAALIAGERAGNLPGVLERLCAYSGYMVETRTRVQEAIAYPVMVVLVAICLMGFLLGFVVPQFAEVFQDFGAQLPYPTRFWINIAMSVRYNYPGMLMTLAVLVIVYHFGRRLVRSSEPGRHAMDWAKLHIPLAGHAFRQNSLSRFCSTFGMLLGARVPLLESLQLSAAAAGNAVLERATGEASRHMRDGASISGSLETSGYFDGTFTWLLGLAEERGEVDAALFQLAETYGQSGRRTSRLLVTIVPMAVLIGLGVIVASIVISIYLPIFTLADVVSGS